MWVTKRCLAMPAHCGVSSVMPSSSPWDPIFLGTTPHCGGPKKASRLHNDSSAFFAFWPFSRKKFTNRPLAKCFLHLDPGGRRHSPWRRALTSRRRVPWRRGRHTKSTSALPWQSTWLTSAPRSMAPSSAILLVPPISLARPRPPSRPTALARGLHAGAVRPPSPSARPRPPSLSAQLAPARLGARHVWVGAAPTPAWLSRPRRPRPRRLSGAALLGALRALPRRPRPGRAGRLRPGSARRRGGRPRRTRPPAHCPVPRSADALPYRQGEKYSRQFKYATLA